MTTELCDGRLSEAEPLREPTETASLRGLTAAEARQRLSADGPNSVDAIERRGAIMAVARRLLNPLVLVLLAAGAVAASTGDQASLWIILTVVLLSVGLDVVQEHRADNAARALQRSVAVHADVLRDGTFRELPVDEVVRGDVIRVTAGDLVPADGRLLETNALQVNEAFLTGESLPVIKEEEGSTADAAQVFGGTSVVAGSGVILVEQTGVRTRLGAIAGTLRRQPPPNAFERGVRQLGLLIVRLTFGLVLLVLLARIAAGRPALETLLFAVALAVGLTPELLPMVLTVSLARGAVRMARAHVIVKRLSAIHDIGEMDVLCTDKTGTLTEGRVSLIECLDPSGAPSLSVRHLAMINARFESGLKSPLDQALLDGERPDSMEGWRKLDERPFDFRVRSVSVLAQCGDQSLEILKGAPEAVLALCSLVDLGGERRPLDGRLRSSIAARADSRGEQGLRLLGVATRSCAGQVHLADVTGEYAFVGLCSFSDPPKPSAASALARLKNQGVQVKILSGDSAAVVSSVAHALGLEVGEVLTGDQVAHLDDLALGARVEGLSLFARIAPEQKTRIVRALKSRGAVVGFVGDGINDAAAIHEADVGLSVAGATDVARDAADMILLAPDLNVLADGVSEGRQTCVNILNYIRMRTSSNFGNMLTMALASIVLPFLPLTAVQILINNLLYDLSQSGLPFDRSDPRQLVRPIRWNMRQILLFTAVMGPLSTLFDVATFTVLLFGVHATTGQFQAAWFMESIATQVLVVFVIRTGALPWKARPAAALVMTTMVALALAVSMLLLPLSRTVGFSPLPWWAWGVMLALTLGYLVAAEPGKRLAARLARGLGRTPDTFPPLSG